jgi:hypothetical protein
MANIFHRREKKPLDIRLTMRVRFGEQPDEQVTVVNDRRLKLVGSVFQYRDRAINFLVYEVLRAGARQPKVYGGLAPAATSMMKAFTKRFRGRS